MCMRNLLKLPGAWCSSRRSLVELCSRARPSPACFKAARHGFCAVSAARVKELRDRTGASMGKPSSQCREALKESGDLEEAVEWLKKRGVRSMEKRAAESMEALLSLGLDKNGVIVELRAETDFVTRNELFQQTLRHLAKMLAAEPETADAGIEAALAMRVADGPERPPQLREGAPLSEALLELGSVLGEKLVLANVHFLKAPAEGVVAGYVHPKFADSLSGTGRMAGLVSVSGGRCDSGALHRIASRLARHVVAAQPRFLHVGSVPEVENSKVVHISGSNLRDVGDRGRADKSATGEAPTTTPVIVEVDETAPPDVISEIKDLVIDFEEQTTAWYHTLPTHVQRFPLMGKLTPGVNWHVRQDRKYLDPTPLEELKTKNHEYIRGKIEMNKIDDRWEFILDEIIGEVKMGRMNGPFAAPDWWPTLTAAPRHEGVNKLLPLPHDDPFIAMAVSIEQAGSDGNAKIRRGNPVADTYGVIYTDAYFKLGEKIYRPGDDDLPNWDSNATKDIENGWANISDALSRFEEIDVGFFEVPGIDALHIFAPTRPPPMGNVGLPEHRAETLRKEREVFKAAYLEQLGPRKAGLANDQVIQKVLDGKTSKFYQESVLACQELVAPQTGEKEKALPVSEWLEAEARSLSLGAGDLQVEDFKLAVL
ncbi:Elongation factor Ts [Symbiodinium microadriaticum]|uniref:Elongation factor Ts, mitochondrial n=1 Tax=Symbiodinium microadriaticum TaxID=2951 RepID=A0A1Q9CKH2_SYMMI|nr:Elongation factor Ts [Symbiodinium microadriaticum]